MNKKNLIVVTKRWSVMRKTTGKIVKSFTTRAAARTYKRTTKGNFGLYDTERMVAVR